MSFILNGWWYFGLVAIFFMLLAAQQFYSMAKNMQTRPSGLRWYVVWIMSSLIFGAFFMLGAIGQMFTYVLNHH